jgi:glycosyltransferase involved in cell wall biosynthesis
MGGRKKIICTVTNDLSFDQRMHRICSSLSAAGYEVVLTGRKRKSSRPLEPRSYNTVRLHCFFDKGKLFYAEYNLRLFFWLLLQRTNVYCAIDLDTILPNYFASVLRGKKRVYDAHELFCEMDEIRTRPAVYRMWKAIERFCVPRFSQGYTIGECYAEKFKRMYGVNYTVVRNATILQEETLQATSGDYILYQGAVNEGRCFETLIPAMKQVNIPLIICGEGNFYEQAQALAREHGVEDRVQFKGYVEPQALKNYTRKAMVGITLFTGQGKSNYFSMANRFFDYMHAGVPQLCVAYPEYQRVNRRYELAMLLEDTSSDAIAAALNRMTGDAALLQRMRAQALLARQEYCWQEEEKKLITFYRNLLG